MEPGELRSTMHMRRQETMSGPTTGDFGFRMLPVESIAKTDGSAPVDISIYPGRLIALEGTDGVGRSTQIALLREWLETQGFGVLHTGLTRSRLAGDGLRKAKQGTTLSQRTLDLFYATDFADRLETDILPALRAGLSDEQIATVVPCEGVADFSGLTVVKRGHSPATRAARFRTSGGSPPWFRRNDSPRRRARVCRS